MQAARVRWEERARQLLGPLLRPDESIQALVALRRGPSMWAGAWVGFPLLFVLDYNSYRRTGHGTQEWLVALIFVLAFFLPLPFTRTLGMALTDRRVLLLKTAFLNARPVG